MGVMTITSAFIFWAIFPDCPVSISIHGSPALSAFLCIQESRDVYKFTTEKHPSYCYVYQADRQVSTTENGHWLANLDQQERFWLK